MSRLTRPAARIAAGSSAAARRLGDRTAAWVRRGRRDDLTGWRAALGCWLRLAAIGLGLYLLWRLVRAVPNLMWLLTGAWIVVAWRAGKAVPEAEDGDPDEEPAPAAGLAPRVLLVHWLEHLTRDRAGIHLDDLHRTLIQHPDLAGLKRAEMRAWLDRHRITVDRTLRVGSVAGRSGVSRATVEVLLAGCSPTVESGRSPAPLHASDQHDSTAESGVESGVEPGVDPYSDDVAGLFV